MCTVEGTLALARKSCDNREFCFLFAHADTDPCPTVSKYLEVVFSCEQNGERKPVYERNDKTFFVFLSDIIPIKKRFR